MPRTLPWLKNGGASSRSRSTIPRGDDEGARNRAKASKRVESGLRSSSPVQSPGRSSGDDKGMRKGYKGDDIWMMVEDDFLATAQLYTRHLHQAEYVRLQEEAEQREEAMPSHASNPMAGFVPQNRSVPRTSRRKSSSSSGHDIPIHDPTLAYLMDSPRKQPALLKRGRTDITATPTRSRFFKESKDRYSAGEISTPASDAGDDETDDDLDVPGSRYERPSRPPRTVPTTKPSSGEHFSRATASGYQNPRSRLSVDRDNEPHDEYRREGKDGVADIIARRKMKAKGKQVVNDATTEIPTFLF